MSALDIQIGGSHYKDYVIQPVEFSTKNGLGFIEGSIIKYISRHNKPTGKGRQDLEKIKHYIDLLIELQYPESPKEREYTHTKESWTCTHGPATKTYASYVEAADNCSFCDRMKYND